MSVVYVSGATGFIAQHIIKTLIAKNYSVVGLVRSAAKGDGLKQHFGDKFTYEIVEDIKKPGAFDQLLQKHPEVLVFLHTALPFHYNGDPETDLMIPAVEGTKNALAAIKAHGKNVKRVVITSLYASIADALKESDPNATITEALWNEILWDDAKQNPINGYRGSKTYAEKAAWEFVKTEKPQWDLTCVNPSFVFGPQAFDEGAKRDHLNTSLEVINKIINLKPDSEIPPNKGGWVDVRDVAKAHVVAFEKDEAKGQRLLVNAGRFSCQLIIDILNADVPELKGKIPVGEPGLDKKAIATLAKVDNHKTNELLGFKYIDLKTSVVDTVTQILQAKM